MSTMVIKVGGAFLDNSELALSLLKTFSQLRESYSLVVVHGGGNAVEKLLQDLGQTSSKIDGLRVTPAEQIDYVVGALAGTANKQLCGLAIRAGLKPVGLCLADGNMTTSVAISPELGCVGKVVASDPALLTTLMAAEFIPIVSSIGADAQGNLLNVNADQAATAIAQVLNAQLYLLSDVVGVMDQQKNVFPSLGQAQIEQLIAQNVIRDGMKVKVDAALQAANQIRQPVTIASWLHPEAIFNLPGQHSHGLQGTKILPNNIGKDC